MVMRFIIGVRPQLYPSHQVHGHGVNVDLFQSDPGIVFRDTLRRLDEHPVGDAENVDFGPDRDLLSIVFDRPIESDLRDAGRVFPGDRFERHRGVRPDSDFMAVVQVFQAGPDADKIGTRKFRPGSLVIFAEPDLAKKLEFRSDHLVRTRIGQHLSVRQGPFQDDAIAEDGCPAVVG